MRNFGFIIGIIVMSLTGYSQTELTRKEKKEAKRDSAYMEMVILIESGEFMFDARRANPQSGRMIDLTTHRAEFTIANDTAAGFLPFFGTAYNPEYGGGGGLEFDNVIEKYAYKRIDDKRKIRIKFEVQGESDRYVISMDISTMESVSVTVTSNRRAPISYSGNIRVIDKTK